MERREACVPPHGRTRGPGRMGSRSTIGGRVIAAAFAARWSVAGPVRRRPASPGPVVAYLNIAHDFPRSVRIAARCHRPTLVEDGGGGQESDRRRVNDAGLRQGAAIRVLT